MTDRVDALLADAVSAARQRAQLGVDEGAATRLRLRESLTRGSTRRRRRLTIIAAVIASLFGSTAYALVTGWRPPPLSPTTVASVTPAIEPPVIEERPHVERRKTVVRPTAAPPVVAVAVAPVEVAPGVEPPVAPTPSTAAPSTTAPSTTTTARSTTAPSTTAPSTTAPSTTAPRVASTAPSNRDPNSTPSPPARSAELAAYRIAHGAHFRGNDPKAALAAWDAYLAKFPDGQLAPEARYDRALVLIKLKRLAEAKQALAPFAAAPVGSYRQREAAKLLEALR